MGLGLEAKSFLYHCSIADKLTRNPQATQPSLCMLIGASGSRSVDKAVYRVPNSMAGWPTKVTSIWYSERMTVPEPLLQAIH